jgi:hypothetical protein
MHKKVRDFTGIKEVTGALVLVLALAFNEITKADVKKMFGSLSKPVHIP